MEAIMCNHQINGFQEGPAFLGKWKQSGKGVIAIDYLNVFHNQEIAIAIYTIVTTISLTAAIVAALLGVASFTFSAFTSSTKVLTLANNSCGSLSIELLPGFNIVQ